MATPMFSRESLRSSGIHLFRYGIMDHVRFSPRPDDDDDTGYNPSGERGLPPSVREDIRKIPGSGGMSVIVKGSHIEGGSSSRMTNFLGGRADLATIRRARSLLILSTTLSFPLLVFPTSRPPHGRF